MVHNLAKLAALFITFLIDIIFEDVIEVERFFLVQNNLFTRNQSTWKIWKVVFFRLRNLAEKKKV